MSPRTLRATPATGAVRTPTARPIPQRIAFWASVVGGIASLGGNVTVIVLTGSPNAGSLLILLCWLASAGLLASTIRWAPLASTVLGGAIVGQLLAAPYVLEHLTDPSGASGGFGVFAGDVAVLLCALLVFGGSLVALLGHTKRERQ